MRSPGVYPNMTPDMGLTFLYLMDCLLLYLRIKEHEFWMSK